ncbi:MAG: patatin-like phospholipase family protein [Pseudomonas protegens]|nr:MAG: patatin-like phospholipase family protein [Pseudomonas protegens]WEK23819.1 MAG: patatin-like phospholipase family protein [Pseudomonas protegens]
MGTHLPTRPYKSNMTSTTEDAVEKREAPFTSSGANDELFEKVGAHEPLPKSPVFLALQGGGAKGIVHIGGIAALEELNFDIRAVSGTSAGSMVAALIAAGFNSKDLVDPDGKKHFFGTKLFGKEKGQLKYSKPTHLFTRRGWFTIKSAVLLGKALKAFWPWPGDSKVETTANCIWLTIIAHPSTQEMITLRVISEAACGSVKISNLGQNRISADTNRSPGNSPGCCRRIAA